MSKNFNWGQKPTGGSNPDIDLSNYYTKEETNELLDNVSVDLSNYFTKQETTDLLQSVNQDFENLQNDFNSFKTNSDDFNVNLVERLDTVEAKATANTTNIETLQNTLNTNYYPKIMVDKKIQSVNDEITNTNIRLTDYKRENNSYLDNIEANIDTINSNLETTNNTVATNNTTLTTNLNNLSNNLSNNYYTKTQCDSRYGTTYNPMVAQLRIMDGTIKIKIKRLNGSDITTAEKQNISIYITACSGNTKSDSIQIQQKNRQFSYGTGSEFTTSYTQYTSISDYMYFVVGVYYAGEANIFPQAKFNVYVKDYSDIDYTNSSCQWINQIMLPV